MFVQLAVTRAVPRLIELYCLYSELYSMNGSINTRQLCIGLPWASGMKAGGRVP